MGRPAHICDCGDHAWVGLTLGYVALIDPEFAPVVSRYFWNASIDRSCVYARRNHHERVNGRKRSMTIRMQHLVLPTSESFLVDHKNRNGLDNRSRNLRLATVSENACNKRGKATATSRFRGVSLSRGRWRALIGFGGDQQYLGIYPTEEEAALAYDRAASRFHGESAHLNAPTLRADEEGR